MSQTQNFIPEFGFMSLLGGISEAILGRFNPKFRLYSYQYGPNWNPARVQMIPIDCSYGQLLNVAHNVPHLNVVISKGAEMFSNMRIKHCDSKGNEIEFKNSPVLQMLRKPNPLQKTGAFVYDFFINWAVYNVNFIYKNKGINLPSALPKTMWNLPSGLMQYQITGMLYDQTEIDGIIKWYKIINREKKYLPHEIILMSEGISENGITAKSRIESLQIPLSNIVASLKSLNIIITERGMIGFISADASQKDSDGPLPFDEEERKRVETDYKNRYSVDGIQGHVGFTGANIKWTPLTFDVGQLKLLEGLEDSFGLICGEYGIDRDIFPTIKGATHENKEKGERGTYQNTMQPLADKLMDELSDAFGLHEKGEYLSACYDHLPVMKEDEVKKADAELKRTQRHKQLKADGIINAEAYAEMEGIELSGDGVTQHPPSSLSLNNGQQQQE